MEGGGVGKALRQLDNCKDRRNGKNGLAELVGGGGGLKDEAVS